MFNAPEAAAAVLQLFTSCDSITRATRARRQSSFWGVCVRVCSKFYSPQACGITNKLDVKLSTVNLVGNYFGWLIGDNPFQAEIRTHAKTPKIMQYTLHAATAHPIGNGRSGYGLLLETSHIKLTFHCCQSIACTSNPLHTNAFDRVNKIGRDDAV